MDSRLTEACSWISAIACATAVLALGVWLTQPEFSQPTSYLLLGLVPWYLLSSTYICLHVVRWLDGRTRFSRLTAVIVSVALVLATSWVVFGAYFYMTGKFGYDSTVHLGLELFLRQTLRIQVAMVPLVSACLVRAGGRIDLAASIVVAALVIVFALF